MQDLAKFKNTTKFVTTPKKVTKWFNKLNHVIFEDVLTPFSKITVKDTKKNWGCIRYYAYKTNPKISIHIHKKFVNKWFFINILAHEMVHKWQVEIIQDTGNHNKHFFSWRPIFALHGLDLNRKA